MRMLVPTRQILAACNPQTSATRDDDSVLIAKMVRTSYVFVRAESHLRGVIAYRLVERAHERHSELLWHQAG
jgi:hypothetical protein